MPSPPITAIRWVVMAGHVTQPERGTAPPLAAVRRGDEMVAGTRAVRADADVRELGSAPRVRAATGKARATPEGPGDSLGRHGADAPALPHRVRAARGRARGPHDARSHRDRAGHRARA